MPKTVFFSECWLSSNKGKQQKQPQKKITCARYCLLATDGLGVHTSKITHCHFPIALSTFQGNASDFNKSTHKTTRTIARKRCCRRQGQKIPCALEAIHNLSMRYTWRMDAICGVDELRVFGRHSGLASCTSADMFAIVHRKAATRLPHREHHRNLTSVAPAVIIDSAVVPSTEG